LSVIYLLYVPNFRNCLTDLSEMQPCARLFNAKIVPEKRIFSAIDKNYIKGIRLNKADEERTRRFRVKVERVKLKSPHRLKD
jgi:hypothetical protein